MRIVRDDYGVPHVYAKTVYGLYYGYGYAIAQDRLFQLEMARRSTQGTVAEVLGADYLDYDRNARTLFSPASIHRQLGELEQKDVDVFEAYAAGINAWLAKIRRAPAELMPKQFIDIGFEPLDWSAYDVAMNFIGTMNNRYGDFNTELENAEIYRSLVNQHGEAAGARLFDLLNPRFTHDAPTTVPREDWSRPAYDALAKTRAVNLPKQNAQIAFEGPLSSGFSNCFVLGRDKAEGASAILVNGPQFGWFNPAYVYSIGMHGAGIDVVGNSPFGYPMVMFGHNRSIAWGSTWGASDIVDLFAEQLDPDDANRYRYQGAYRGFEHRVEHIGVKGGDSVDYDVYRSVHGPITYFDRAHGIAYAKQRAWDGIELDTLLAWLHATWADDWGSWQIQAVQSAINVNMYFADVDGNIGYFHGGRFPRRTAGHDNRFPVSGDGSMDWQGRQDIDLANPHVLNPSSGFIANWNNKPGEGVMNPDFFFYSWSNADRIDVFNTALGEKDRFTPDEAWALIEQSSYADIYARYFLPLIDAALADSAEFGLREANEILQSWNRQSRDDDGDGFYDEPATAIFRTFIDELVERVLKDDLGNAYPYFAASGYPTATRPTGAGTNLPSGVKAVIEALDGDTGYDLLNGVAPDVIIADSMREAISRLDEYRLPVAQRPFSTRNFLGVPQAGDGELLTAPIEQNRGTENDMIVMKPGAIVGWEVVPPGENAFIAPDDDKSVHYDDQFGMYQTFGRKRMWFYPDDVEAHKQSETVLIY